MEISRLAGSVLSGNQHHHHVDYECLRANGGKHDPRCRLQAMEGVDHRGELTRVNAEVPKLLIQIKLRIARCALMAFDMRRVT